MHTKAGDRTAGLFLLAGKDGKYSAKRGLSVATRVVFFLAVVATCLLVGAAWFGAYEMRSSENAKLRQLLVAETDQLSAGLSLPLWNFDDSQVRKILDSEMRDRNLIGVVVKQLDPKTARYSITYARTRDPQWRSVPATSDIPTDGLWVEERSITAMGEPIGSVKLLATNKFLEQELHRRMLQAAGLTLLSDLLLIASLYYVLWKLVLKPLRSIERYATAVSSGRNIPAEVYIKASYGSWKACAWRSGRWSSFSIRA
jgi:hypothetical protein